MRFLTAANVFVSVALALLAYTQLLRPLLRGTRFFPAFRRRRREIAEALVEQREGDEVRKLGRRLRPVHPPKEKP